MNIGNDLTLLTVKQVSQILTVTPKTVSRMQTDGRLQYVKFSGGRTVRFKLSDIREFIDNSLVKKEVKL